MHSKLPQKREIQKTTKLTGDLVGNKIVGKVTKAASKRTYEAPSKLMMPLGTGETSIQPV